jgi:hypothetical protein
MKFLAFFGLVLIAAAAQAQDSIITTYEKELKFPIVLDEKNREKCFQLWLCVSTDKGKTWMVADKGGPETMKFLFKVPKNGSYWFSVQVVYKDMTRKPSDLSKEPPGLQILVKEKPEEEIKRLEKDLVQARELLDTLLSFKKSKKYDMNRLEKDVNGSRERIFEIEKRLAELKKEEK